MTNVGIDCFLCENKNKKRHQVSVGQQTTLSDNFENQPSMHAVTVYAVPS